MKKKCQIYINAGHVRLSLPTILNKCKKNIAVALQYICDFFLKYDDMAQYTPITSDQFKISKIS